VLWASPNAPEGLPWVSSGAADPHKIPIDPNGNLATKTEGTDNWSYEWNARNELTRALKNGVEQAHFAYDPLGRRVERVAGAVTTTYAYDGENILREARGASTLKYIQGLGVDQPLARDNGTAPTYFHADALGSVNKITDTAGAVTFTREYDAWGGVQAGAGEPGYAFTGREWDPETGLFYYRARYYDPKLGRFVSEDPIAFEGGINHYVYARANTTTWTDPSGLFTTWPDYFVCFGDWEGCQAKRRCVPQTEDMVNKEFGPDIDGTRRNAFKHCYLACCMSKKTSPCRTEKQLQAHEQYRGNPPQDMYMDLYNNYQGAGLAEVFPKKSCRRICLDAPARWYLPDPPK
jgi:RHS repeat-associated protein